MLSVVDLEPLPVVASTNVSCLLPLDMVRAFAVLDGVSRGEEFVSRLGDESCVLESLFTGGVMGCLTGLVGV